MTYYKIIQNGMIIDVGFTFLKWNMKQHRMFICDQDHAQFVGGSDGNSYYRDNWLKPYPDEAVGFMEATVSVIDFDEYEQLVKDLENNREVPDETPIIPDPEPIEIGEEVSESVLTIGEMRKIILQQQKQIAELTKILNK